MNLGPVAGYVTQEKKKEIVFIIKECVYMHVA